MDFLGEDKKFLRETKKLYTNLKQLGVLTNIEIDVDKKFIAYSLKSSKHHEIYTKMCHEIKDSVKENRPITIICNPLEGCLNHDYTLRREISIKINETITNNEQKKEILYATLLDLNKILKEIIKYRYKR